MGFIDFVKGAGAKLFGREEEKVKAQAPTVSAAELNRIRDRHRGAALVAQVEKLGFSVEDLAIVISGDDATVTGTAPSQEVREKVVLVIGNTAGLARVDDQMVVETPEPEAVYHTVVSGDSLSKIAKKHYGNAMKYPMIFEANKPMLSDPDKIYPGQVLRIPPTAAEAG